MNAAQKLTQSWVEAYGLNQHTINPAEQRGTPERLHRWAGRGDCSHRLRKRKRKRVELSVHSPLFKARQAALV